MSILHGEIEGLPHRKTLRSADFGEFCNVAHVTIIAKRGKHRVFQRLQSGVPNVLRKLSSAFVMADGTKVSTKSRIIFWLELFYINDNFGLGMQKLKVGTERHKQNATSYLHGLEQTLHASFFFNIERIFCLFFHPLATY